MENIMSGFSKESSVVRGSHNEVVAKDTTYTRPDGSSKTVHQEAEYTTFGNVAATRITGVTENKDGTSTNKKP